MASQAYYDFAALLKKNRSEVVPSLEERRAGWDKLAEGFPPDERVICGPFAIGTTQVEWLRWPNFDTEKTLLYFHGGGYCMCDARGHRHLISQLALASGVQALSVDYRLAPEAPFPAAVEDAVNVYTWLSEQVGSEQIIVGGDSAGGGLTLALLLEIANHYLSDGHTLTQPCAAFCISPVTDLAKTGASFLGNAHLDPAMVPASSAELAKLYAGTEENLTHPLASPLYGDYQGLPPLMITVGTWEILLDDSLRVADKAKNAGVQVELEVGQDLMHIWPYFVGVYPEAAETVANIGAFNKRQFSARQGL